MDSEIKIGQYLIALSGAYLEIVLCIQRISETKSIVIINTANPENEGEIRDCSTPISSLNVLLERWPIICDKPEDAFLIAINKSRIKMRYGNCEQT